MDRVQECRGMESESNQGDIRFYQGGGMWYNVILCTMKVLSKI
jgi:hypothetical protein